MRNRLLAVGTLTALTLTAAACGSKSHPDADSTSKDGSATPSTSAPTFTGEIKIGAIAELSMPSALGDSEPEVGDALQAGVDAINAKGGINGKKLVLEVCDEKASPNDAAQCARKLVKDGVVAEVGSLSTFGDSISPVMQAAGVPRIGPSCLSNSEYNAPGNYPLNGGGVVMFQGAAIDAAEQGAKKIFIAYTDTAGSGAIPSFVSTVYAAHNLKDVGRVGIPDSAPDLSPYVNKAIHSGADVVLTTFGPGTTQQFIKTSIQLGATYRIATVADALSDSVIKSIGADQPMIKNILLTSPMPPAGDNDVPAIKEFNAELDAAQKAGRSSLDPTNRSHVLNSWVSLQAFDQIATSITGAITPATFTAAVKAAKNIDLGGVMPPWTPSARGAVLPNVSNGTGWFIKVDNGKLVLDKTEPQPILAALGS